MDYWVIVHKFFSDAFYSYHLSAGGIIDTVISHIGSVHPTGFQGSGTAIGQLKASPNGQKLAIVNGNANPGIAEYFDFDKTTGIVSNSVSVQTNPLWSYYGVSFSQDNSKLYIACTLNGNGVYQFDLNAGGGNPVAVVASKTLIAGTYNYLGLQLATDGKIYVARSPFGSNTYLGVINYPNNPGTSCNYIDSAINLNGHSASYGLPNFIDSYDYSNTIFNCPTGIEEEIYFDGISIFPNPFSSQTTLHTNNLLHNATLTVYNVYGQTVKQIKNISGQTVVLSRDNFPSGLYFVRLTEENKTIAADKLLITDN